MATSLKVVASFSILGDLVQQVGGNRVVVTTLVGPDGDAHVFEPTPANARAIGEAGLVVTNGLGLEGWMPRLIHSTGYRGPVVVATEGVVRRTGFSEDHGRGGVDPHAWQNVVNSEIYVRNILAGLVDADPPGGDVYRANAAAYTARLEALDRFVRDAFKRVPVADRKIITSHDALGYYGDAYGLTLLAPLGFSTEADASAKTVAALIRQIRNEHIKAIFIENMSDSRLIAQISREAGAKVGGRLFSDALSLAAGPAASYEAMIRHNTGQIIEALTGAGLR